MRREIVLDTETTGLKPEEGHRILEIGCVEMIDGKVTGKEFHVYINPERESDPGAFMAHKLTTEFLSDKPKFHEIIDEFLAFIQNSELVIHNADFDLKFLNSELDKAGKGKIWNYIKNVTCTLKLDKRLFAEKGQKHSLDAMCERFGISLDEREEKGHGALLDCHLLAGCYLKTKEIYSTEDIEADLEQINWQRPAIKRYNVPLQSVIVSEQEEKIHSLNLDTLEKETKVMPVFKKQTQNKIAM